STEWKSYKANEHFEPDDSSNTSGTKTFEQSIVPMKAGTQEIPAVKFSFFDPDTQQYVTESTSPIAVNIAQNTSAPAEAPAATPVASAPASDAPKSNPGGLAPDQAVPAETTSSLRPLMLAPSFIAVNAAMLAAIAFGGLFRKLRAYRANDPQRLQREAAEKAVSESLAAMDAALKNKDTPRFFDAARHALQERLAAQWHMPASEVTISEIRSRLSGHGEQVGAVFLAADEIAYSGTRFTALDLQQWRDLVKNQLQQLTSV
ncbi:MAG: hypothetical protein RL693_1010, partial [Verrucomicrobiota bacterium]